MKTSAKGNTDEPSATKVKQRKPSHREKTDIAKRELIKTIKGQYQENNIDIDTANDLEFIIVEFLDKVTPSGKAAYTHVEFSVDEEDDFAPYNERY